MHLRRHFIILMQCRDRKENGAHYGNRRKWERNRWVEKFWETLLRGLRLVWLESRVWAPAGVCVKWYPRVYSQSGARMQQGAICVCVVMGMINLKGAAVVANEDARRRRRWRGGRQRRGEWSDRAAGRRQGCRRPSCVALFCSLCHIKRELLSAREPAPLTPFYAFYVPVVVSKIISEILARLLALSFVRSAGDKQASATWQIYVCMHTRHQRFFFRYFCLRATACETYYFMPCLNGIPTQHTAK